MAIPSLRVEQHAKILGFSIIGYGIAAVIDQIIPFFQAKKLSSMYDEQLSILGDSSKKGIEFESYLWPKVLFAVGLFVLCIITSAVVRKRDENPKALALTLAVLVFGFFPLGTLLSVYILIYLFVIDDGDYTPSSTVNTVHLNG